MGRPKKNEKKQQSAEWRYRIPCKKLIRQQPHDEASCPFSHDFQVCSICNVYLTTRRSVLDHTKGKQHKQNLLKSLLDVDPIATDIQVENYYCELCLRDFSSSERLFAHQKTLMHRRKETAYLYQQRLQVEMSDKNEVVITPKEGLNFGVTDESQTEKLQKFVTIKNNSDSYSIRLNKVFPKRINRFYDKIFTADPVTSVKIPPGNSMKLYISISPIKVGLYQRTYVFQFEKLDNRGRKNFEINRVVKVSIGEREIIDLLQPAKPYQEPPREVNKSVDEISEAIVEGVSPIPAPEWEKYEGKRIQYRRRSYSIPKDFENAVLHSHKRIHSFKVLTSKYIPEMKSLESYTSFWHALLWLEECQMILDIRRYDLKGVTMGATEPAGRSGKSSYYNEYPGRNLWKYTLQVLGLAEKRPSVRFNDRVKVKPTDSKICYHGYAAEVRLTDVVLQFSAKFDRQFIANKKFDVEFTFARAPLIRMHTAADRDTVMKSWSYLEKRFSLKSLNLNDIKSDPSFKVFIETLSRFDPKEEMSKIEKERKDMLWYNKNFENNLAQQTCVTTIKLGVSHPLPYVIFGPPGTGKTNTLVEAIKQIILADSKSKILVACPSNDACDLIVMRLADHIPVSRMFRLNARTRSTFMTIEPTVMKYSLYDESNGYFLTPSVEQFQRYQVVVTTCVSAGFTADMKLSKNHFSHVFVDEAGQSMENEIQVAISSVSPDAKFVLAGDHKQLGPTIRSVIAKKYGLHISFLEKWMKMITSFVRVEEKETQMAKIVRKYIPNIEQIAPLLYCQLTNNYRSHEKILELPNRLFYNNTLIPKADPVLVNQFLDSKDLKISDFPVIFLHEEGQDMREGDSPSWYNPSEVLQVSKIIETLKSSRKHRCADHDIGVVTPYFRQVQKIHSVLRNKAPGVKVGSVENFQGQEKKVIIISTVRSSPDHIAFDKAFQLGFLSESKRFNVAITRAKALLVVIGNANILWMDECWRKLIQLCLSRNTVRNWEGPVEGTVTSEPALSPPNPTSASSSSSTPSTTRATTPTPTPSTTTIDKDKENENPTTSINLNKKMMSLNINDAAQPSQVPEALHHESDSEDSEDGFEIILFDKHEINDIEWVDRE